MKARWSFQKNNPWTTWRISRSCFIFFRINMKIAIVWSHGTGKSSLLDAIPRPVENKIQEVARKIITEIWILPQDMEKRQKEIFQIKVYEEQREQEKHHVHFVSDRGVYDNLAYVSFVSEPLYKLLLADAKATHRWYDRVFYIPIEFPLVSDWVRFDNVSFQKEVDTRILEIMDLFKVEYRIITWSTENRVRQMGF